MTDLQKVSIYRELVRRSLAEFEVEMIPAHSRTKLVREVSVKQPRLAQR